MPFQGSQRIKKALTNVSVKYKNNEMIAGQFMKDMPVVKDAEKYYVYASEFRIPETLRANGSPSNQIKWEVSTSSYVVDKHSLSDVITDDDRQNEEAPLSLDVDTTENLTDKILLRQEFEAAKLLFTTTTFSSNATLNTATSWKYNTTTSAPIQNVLSATGAIIKAAGKMPNTGITGWDGFEALKENQNIYSRIQYVERAILTKEILASLFDLDNFYVGTAIYDSAKEGDTESTGFVWGSDCLIAYFNPSMGRKQVTAAINIRSTQYGTPYITKKWREEAVEGDMIEVTSKFKPKAVATACAYLFKTVALS